MRYSIAVDRVLPCNPTQTRNHALFHASSPRSAARSLDRPFVDEAAAARDGIRRTVTTPSARKQRVISSDLHALVAGVDCRSARTSKTNCRPTDRATGG